MAGFWRLVSLLLKHICYNNQKLQTGATARESIYSTCISTDSGQKKIEVYCCDVTLFDETIDILTTSAFEGSYAPSPRTVFKALYDIGISVQELSRKPFIDLRQSCHTWLSTEVASEFSSVRRIGCIELRSRSTSYFSQEDLEQSMLNSIRAYFHMLDIAAIYEVKMETVALPLLGSGNQNIAARLMTIPLLNECIAFLKRNNEVKRICFIERNAAKAELIAKSIQQSHNIALLSTHSHYVPSKPKAFAFISYSSRDKNIADNLCFKLEQRGIAVWYAPRDVQGPYANAIVQAIDKCTHFIVILSQNSMASEHVLNEIDLAFQRLPNQIMFKPLRVDNSLFTPSFKYYLSRQHWMDATVPPLEKRLNDFADNLLVDM